MAVAAAPPPRPRPTAGGPQQRCEECGASAASVPATVLVRFCGACGALLEFARTPRRLTLPAASRAAITASSRAPITASPAPSVSPGGDRAGRPDPAVPPALQAPQQPQHAHQDERTDEGTTPPQPETDPVTRRPRWLRTVATLVVVGGLLTGVGVLADGLVRTQQRPEAAGDREPDPAPLPGQATGEAVDDGADLAGATDPATEPATDPDTEPAAEPSEQSPAEPPGAQVTVVPDLGLRWQRDLAGIDPRRVAFHDGVVVVVDETMLVAIDAETGWSRWAVPIGDLLPSDPTDRDAVRVAAGPDGAVLTSPSMVTLLEAADGARRWSVDSPGYRIFDAALLDHAVVLTTRTQHGEGRSPRRLALLDLDTGQTRWDRILAEVHDLADDLLIADDPAGALVGIAWATGLSQWTSSEPADQVRIAGSWVVVTEARRTRLLAREDGREGPVLDRPLLDLHAELDLDAEGSPDAGWFTVLVLAADPAAGTAPGGAAGPEVIAVDADGVVRWRYPTTTDPAPWCCTEVAAHDGRVVLVGTDRRVVLDGRDGRLLDDPAPPRLSGPGWIRPDGVVVTQPEPDLSGRPTLTVRTPDAQDTVVSSTPLQVLTLSPLVLMVDGGLVGIHPRHGVRNPDPADDVGGDPGDALAAGPPQAAAVLLGRQDATWRRR